MQENDVKPAETCTSAQAHPWLPLLSAEFLEAYLSFAHHMLTRGLCCSISVRWLCTGCAVLMSYMLQIGLDIAGEAVQRASRKLVAAYRQAADPLSDPLQQWQGLGEGGAKLIGGPVSKQLPSSQLFHGDIATASATKPGKCSLGTGKRACLQSFSQ